MLCGGFPQEELRDAGCIAIYESPADLLTKFERSPLVDEEEELRRPA
jgi:hypothetical protein